MPAKSKIHIENYPRIQVKGHEFEGFLDEQKLVQHTDQISEEVIEKLILEAIEKANAKSGREIMPIDAEATAEEIEATYKETAWELFKYFQAYPGDPASTAHQIEGKASKVVAEELFRTRTLQMERMNSGWRYQYLAVDCAGKTGRFVQVSDLGAKEADFVAVIRLKDGTKPDDQVNLYVSVKNRSNTIGGPDWPKSIAELENYASSDKNKTGPYCCIFGIAIDGGLRQMKRRAKSKEVYSWNTEVWLSDYFWPFFTNYDYAAIMLHVLDVLKSAGYRPDKLPNQVKLPEQLLDLFTDYCQSNGLLDENDMFNDAYKLVAFFCGPKVRKPKVNKG